DPGVEQLVLELMAAAGVVGLHQVLVGIGALRVLVEPLHVRVRGRGVEVEVVLLHVLAVVALAVGETEEALLQDRVGAVPQREGEAQLLLVVGEARQAVLAPAVRARPRLVMGEVVPGVAIGAVVLAHGAPLALAQVWAPLAPRDALLAGFVESCGLCVGRHRTGELGESGTYGDRVVPPVARNRTACWRTLGRARMPWPCGGGKRHRPATPPAAMSARFAGKAMARASASVSGFATIMSPM